MKKILYVIVEEEDAYLDYWQHIRITGNILVRKLLPDVSKTSVSNDLKRLQKLNSMIEEDDNGESLHYIFLLRNATYLFSCINELKKVNGRIYTIGVKEYGFTGKLCDLLYSVEESGYPIDIPRYTVRDNMLWAKKERRPIIIYPYEGLENSFIHSYLREFVDHKVSVRLLTDTNKTTFISHLLRARMIFIDNSRSDFHKFVPVIYDCIYNLGVIPVFMHPYASSRKTWGKLIHHKALYVPYDNINRCKRNTSKIQIIINFTDNMDRMFSFGAAVIQKLQSALTNFNFKSDKLSELIINHDRK